MFNLRVRGLPLQSVPRVARVRPLRFDRTTHVFFCICDHFEPQWKGHCSGTRDPNRPLPPRHVQDARVHRWVKEYPQKMRGLADLLGRAPQHTFFFPEDEYDDDHAEYLDQLRELCQQGYGDVEVHLHHEHDTSETLTKRLVDFVEQLHNRHGLLRKDEQGRILYGFSHGDWALDNSRPDGQYCGVNDEISVLLKTGCYADYTLPSAPSPCQTATVNSLYYAVDDPARPRSHEYGIAARVGRKAPDDGLLLVQGPLAFDFGRRKWGILPGLENGDLTANRPPTIERFKLWLQAGVCVQGREDWIFIKVYTHGAQDPTTEMFLGPTNRRFHEDVRSFADANPNFNYYYVTAWEMANLVHLAEAGETDPRRSAERWQSSLALAASAPAGTA